MKLELMNSHLTQRIVQFCQNESNFLAHEDMAPDVQILGEAVAIEGKFALKIFKNRK